MSYQEEFIQAVSAPVKGRISQLEAQLLALKLGEKEIISANTQVARTSFLRATARVPSVSQTVAWTSIGNWFLDDWHRAAKLIIEGRTSAGRIDHDFTDDPKIHQAAVRMMASEAGINPETITFLGKKPGTGRRTLYDCFTVIPAFQTAEDAQKLLDWARREYRSAREAAPALKAA